MKLVLLKPRNIGFLTRLIKENLTNKILKKPELTNSVKEYILNNASRNNPQSVLDVMDQYAKKERFLMNVGDVKGKILIKELTKLRENPVVLELGCFCGYSAILMAKNLGDKGKIISIEVDINYAKVAREIIDFAGLKHIITIIEGSSKEIIPTLEDKFDLVFIDHWKDLYKRDLIAIEESGILKKGSVIFADNVGKLISALVGEKGNSNNYLDYVRNHAKFESTNIKTSLEYSNAEDEVEISIYAG
ncbi:MAG: class I SAM-dependent methyltransferase [SAR86 cluster bacterium]|nr:class I SAM-dependent methyltransferase [SAR86 cluster bacterium]